MSEISSTTSATIVYTASQKTQIASAQSTSDLIDAIEQTWGDIYDSESSDTRPYSSADVILELSGTFELLSNGMSGDELEIYQDGQALLATETSGMLGDSDAGAWTDFSLLA